MRGKRRVVLAVAATVVISAAAGSTAAYSAGLNPFWGIRALTRTIANIDKRGDTYERLEAERDQEIAQVQQRAAVIDYQEQRGWLDAPSAAAEQARLDSLEQAITDRTEREKSIARHDYNRAIGQEWRDAARNTLTSAIGVDTRTGQFVTQVIQGKDPLTAGLDTLAASIKPSSSVADFAARLQEAREKLEQAQKALEYVRDPSRIPVQEKLSELLDEAAAAQAAGPQDRSRLDEIDAKIKEVQDTAKQMGAAWKDLTATSVRVDEERFARDQKWLDMNAHVQTLEASDATKAVLAGMARSARERVEAALAEAGVELSDAELARLVGEVAGAYADARAAARENGEDPRAVDMSKVLRDTINRNLEEQGLAPIPAEDEAAEPGASPSVSVSPAPGESPSATAEPGLTPEPPTAVPPTETPIPPVPTATPEPTSTPIPPTATPAPPPPPPSPTPTPTAVPLPIVTVGGAAFTDGSGYAVAATLTIDFRTGAVSGSIRGERALDFTVNCWNPDHTVVVDVAIATFSEAWTSGLGGGVGADGGFSASFSGTTGGSFQLVQPFDVEGCVGREPPFPAPPSSTVAGTLSGTASAGGAVSFSSSTGGAWSGAGGVAY